MIDLGEMVWEDIEKLILPGGWKEIGENDILSLSNQLTALLNFYTIHSQFLPGLTEKINLLDVEIKAQHRRLQYIIDDGYTKIASIPKEFQKNSDILKAYIKNNLCKDSYINLNKDLSRMEKALIDWKKQRDEIEIRMKSLSKALEVGKVILSATKEELKALRGGYHGQN
jgi:hypothetical protein